MAFKRFLSGLCLSFALFSPHASAQDNTKTNISLWKVESPQNTLYLLGSVHVGKTCELNSSRVDAALADAEKTVFELDLTQITPQDQIQLGLELASVGRLRPGDRNLQESISPETYQKLSEKFDQIKPSNLNITLDDLNQLYRPSFISLQMRGFENIEEGISAECGVDRILLSKAKAANKPILELETFEEQTEILKTLLSSQSLEQNLEEHFQQVISNQRSNEVNSLVSSVLDGNLEEIRRTRDESCAEDPDLCYEILEKRNIRWMEQIRTFLQDDEDYFIIVGAAHMVGPNNLLMLLEQEDYQVEPF